MRIPLIERFKISHTLLFATVVLLVQQLEGTELVFSLLTFTYLCIFAAAFNAGRGLFYPSGAFIFFNGVLTAIFGIVYKLFLNEPGQSQLLAPNTTMACYCAGMAVMGIAAYFSHRLIPKQGLLTSMVADQSMKQAAVGCLALGVLITLVTSSASVTSGSLESGVRQLNQFTQMAILLATTYEIQRTRGQRSTNWIVYSAGLWILLGGLSSYSKQGMFTSGETWIIAAAAAQYQFSKKQLIAGVLFTCFAVYYLVPYSQYGRSYNDPDASVAANAAVSLQYLSNLQDTRRLYLESQDQLHLENMPHFYAEPQGLADRLQMLAFDDSIIAYTDQGHVFGLLPTYLSYLNVVPRVFWPDKPTVNFGTAYGRELGVISFSDETTGISFSPIGDAYHQAQWFGVLVVLPLVMFLLFVVTDTLTGSIRDSPWGLLPIVLMSHIAPEGLLGGAVYLTTYGAVALVLIALMAKYVLPLLGKLVFGGDRTRVRRTINFRPKPALSPLREATPGGPASPES